MSRPVGTAVTRWWHIRHAPVRNPGGHIYGQRDMPADTSNRAAFAALAAWLPAGAVWVVSPLQRTRQTAEALREALTGGGRPDEAEGGLRIEPGLIEQNFGDWQGRPPSEVYALLGAVHPFWLSPAETRPPNGESFVELMHRVRQVVDRLSAEHGGRDIVAVTHGGTIRAALAQALDVPGEVALRFSIDTLSLTRLDHITFAEAPPAWRIVGVNRPSQG